MRYWKRIMAEKTAHGQTYKWKVCVIHFIHFWNNFFVVHAISSVLTRKEDKQMSQRNFRSWQPCRLSCSLFVLWGQSIEKMLIAGCSELLNCDSPFSKHTSAYFTHTLNPYPQRLKKISTAAQFSIVLQSSDSFAYAQAVNILWYCSLTFLVCDWLSN